MEPIRSPDKCFPWVLSPEVKLPSSEAKHSFETRAAVTDERSYKFTLLYAFFGCRVTKITVLRQNPILQHHTSA